MGHLGLGVLVLLLSAWSVGFTWVLLSWGFRWMPRDLGGWRFMGVSSALLAVLLLVTACTRVDDASVASSTPAGSVASQGPISSVVDLQFPVDRYPYTGKHIQDAIKAGHSDTCTINREGAKANRALSLKGVPTKQGFDRDEWPMAMCAEGGKGADIEWVPLSDNRGAGSWVGGKLRDLPDGTKVRFVFKDTSSAAEETKLKAQEPKKVAPVQGVEFKTCKDVKAAGAAPIHKGDPGWNQKFDRDGDGVGCES